MSVRVKDRLTLHGSFEEIEEYNSNFKKVKIKVFAFGKNRNNTDIKTSAFSKAKSSIYNIPIVAKYSETNDIYGNEGDLEGHNLKLSQDIKGNWKLIHDTYPFGVVSSDAEITFEEVDEGTEENPDIKVYVVVDNVYLWKRYEATQKIEEWLNNGITPKVSMEINNVVGSFSEENVFEITDFEFEAICALGSDVEPCFPMAQIESYSTQTFEENYYQMIKELKQSVESMEFSSEEIEKEGGKKLSKEKNFSFTASQLRSEIKTELYKYFIEDAWGCKIYKYWYVDHDDTHVIAEDSEDNYRLIGFEYSVENDTVTINFENKKRMKLSYSPIETDIKTNYNLSSSDRLEYEVSVKEKETEKVFSEEKSLLESKVNDFEQKVNVLTEEIEQLREFKQNKLLEERKIAEEELFEKFSKELSEEEISEFKEKASQFSLEELEEKLYVAVGKKKANFSIQPKKEKDKIKIQIDAELDKSTKPYGDLFDRFLN